MRLPILALLSASLVLAGCSANKTVTPSYSILPASVVGGLQTSNDYWAQHQADTVIASSAGSVSSSLTGTASSSSNPTTVSASGTSDWLQLVGMAPIWGPDGHTRTVAQAASTSSATSWLAGTYGATTTTTSSNGTLVLPSGQTAGGTTSNSNSTTTGGNGTLTLPSGAVIGNGSSSTSSGSPSGTTLTLPSGRVIDGKPDQTSMSGSGKTVALNTTSGSSGCNQPDKNQVTAGNGILLPGLYKGNCPLSASIIKLQNNDTGTLGSLDF